MTSPTTVSRSTLGQMPSGQTVEAFRFESAAVKVTLLSHGARVMQLQTADRRGHFADVSLGYASLEAYLADRNSYFGAIAGRFANRVAEGRFRLDGQEHQLPLNDGPNSLHGGAEGFDQRLWTAREIADGVEFTLVSAAGDQGYPGELTATVAYTLRGDTVRLDYTATTDAPTVLNLTNHTYFNLSGEASGSILGEELRLESDFYTPVNESLIPTGVLEPVGGTPFDFTHPQRIGDRIGHADEQLLRARGYDHNWVVRGTPGHLRPAAHVYDPPSGRTLRVETTEPGIQFYSGNFLDGSRTGKSGTAYAQRSGLCLETQHFPDAPNQPGFKSTTLRPGETCRSTTTWIFGVEP